MRPELFVGIVGALGTDIARVVDTLESAFGSVGYATKTIRLTDQLRALPRYRDLALSPVYEYYRHHMQAGDDLCSTTGMPDAMAALAVIGIKAERERIHSGDDTPLTDTAYIIRSLKRPAEVELLRSTYGDRFVLLSAYSPREARVAALADRIATSNVNPRAENFRRDAEDLVSIDESEDVDSGQDVQGTFPSGDVFVDASSPQALISTTRRFVELLFGNDFRTPTIDEFGMFVAFGAARRSADLGRQVGAAILDPYGNVICVGTNEAPKAGGGVYWEGDTPDARDFQIGIDSSYQRRAQLLSDVLSRLGEMKWLARTVARRSVDSLVHEALHGDAKTLRDAQLMDVIEFGRSVHAEMLAITDAAARGVSVKGATLYSTTFPCHNCARHIVSSGISKVVYIEPYPKSLAQGLFRDSIIADPLSDLPNMVTFRPYVGVGPRIYADLFTASERRSADGTPVRWNGNESLPKLVKSRPTYAYDESIVVGNFGSAMKAAGFRLRR